MVDEKKENKVDLIPTREMILAEKKDVLKDASGKALALNKFPDDTRWTMKIVDEPKTYVDKEDEHKKSVYWNVEFKHNKINVPARIRTSHSALLSVEKKYPDKEYIGRYAFFSHLKKGDKNIHSVGVFKDAKEPEEFVDTMDAFQKADNIEQVIEAPKTDVADLKTFIAKFKEQVTQFNKMCEEKGKPEEKKEITKELCELQYFRFKHPEDSKNIQEVFGE